MSLYRSVPIPVQWSLPVVREQMRIGGLGPGVGTTSTTGAVGGVVVGIAVGGGEGFTQMAVDVCAQDDGAQDKDEWIERGPSQRRGRSSHPAGSARPLPLDQPLLLVGLLPPSRSPSWHRLGPRDMSFEAKRSCHVAVAIPEVAVGGFVAASSS